MDRISISELTLKYLWQKEDKNCEFELFKGNEDLYFKLKVNLTIIDDILNDIFFSLIECDIQVPDYFCSYFEEMSLIFKNVEITYSNLSQQTKKQVKANYKTQQTGDENPSYKVRGEMMKLMCNSSYGNHDELEDVYEFHLSKYSFKQSLPIQVSFAVYQLAKLQMLEYYYDFINYYVDLSDLQYCIMDTDSAYIWLGRDDTPDHVKFDSRTPGLFEKEHERDLFRVKNNQLCSYSSQKNGMKLFNGKQLRTGYKTNPIELYNIINKIKVGDKVRVLKTS
ncbi:hypothetical protein BC830DRAFT_1161223 [Chytriomyces sp. MP71]|nr:hypothetical protein BC830DRAFT_1161223 [Chytriomyces sp. MP71]